MSSGNAGTAFVRHCNLHSDYMLTAYCLETTLWLRSRSSSKVCISRVSIVLKARILDRYILSKTSTLIQNHTVLIYVEAMRQIRKATKATIM